MKLINRSGHVITVSNGNLSWDIPIDKELTLTEEDVKYDTCFEIGFFSLREKTENKIEEVRTVGNRYGLLFSSTVYLPAKTLVCFDGYDEIVIGMKSYEFVFLTKLFKKMCIQAPCAENYKAKQSHMFTDPKHTKKFK